MLVLATDKLPEGERWRYELKLDGYRALAIKTKGMVRLVSRNNNDFTRKYPGVVKVLAAMPDDTILDGEVLALCLQEARFGPTPVRPARRRYILLLWWHGRRKLQSLHLLHPTWLPLGSTAFFDAGLSNRKHSHLLTKGNREGLRVSRPISLNRLSVHTRGPRYRGLEQSSLFLSSTWQRCRSMCSFKSRHARSSARQASTRAEINHSAFRRLSHSAKSRSARTLGVHRLAFSSAVESVADSPL